MKNSKNAISKFCSSEQLEYKRCGKSNIFLACEPLAGKRMVKVTERRTALDWACFVEEIAALYEDAEKITLVMDNLNTQNAGSLYEMSLQIRQKRYGIGLSLCIRRSMAVGLVLLRLS